MKVLLFGNGSAGQRHAANLRTLRPAAKMVVCDPVLYGSDPYYIAAYDNWQEFALWQDDGLDAAIIASPTELHAAQLEFLTGSEMPRPIPCYVEKPLLQPRDIGGFVAYTLPRTIGQPCAVGFQYRFSPSIPPITARLRLGSRLAFTARDSLVARYGRDVAGVMGAHAFDLACWLLGNPASVRVKSDGVRLAGTIEHERGTSSYDMDMDAGERVSECVVDGWPVALECDNSVYVECLSKWLDWVDGKPRNPATATLAAGLTVTHIMAEIMNA